MKDTDLVLCARYTDTATASIAQGLLDSCDIPSVIDNEIMGTILPPAGAVRLMVRRMDLDEARKLLAEGKLLD